MNRRRTRGVLLIVASAITLVVAFLDLPLDLDFSAGGVSSILTLAVPAFFVVVALLLALVTRGSIAAGDKVGVTLGAICLGLDVTYLLVRLLSGRVAGGSAMMSDAAYSLVAPLVALSFSVLVTVLGWHLVFPPRSSVVDSGGA